MMGLDANDALSSLTRAARVATARVWAGLGWQGVMGMIFLGLALVFGWQAWALRLNTPSQPQAEVLAQAQTLPSPLLPHGAPPVLPQRTQVAALLSQIEQHVKAQGIAWPQADYRITPLTAEQLSEMVVSFTLQSPYPQLRSFLFDLLDAQPALAVRDLSLRRANSDTADVEAKVVLVVYLRDGWPHAQPWSASLPVSASGVTP